eukprot:RCo038477
MPPKSKPLPKKPAGKAPGSVDKKLPNPKVYLEVSVDGGPSRRIEFELFADQLPLTAQNFKVFCGAVPQPEKASRGKNTSAMTYRNSRIHRLTEYMVQGGDLSAKADGKGQESIYGPSFDDENFNVAYDQPGVLGMANSGPNTNGSQFFITTQAAPWLKGRCVAFGRVISGMDVVYALGALLPNADPVTGRPREQVVITGCGAVPLTPEEEAAEAEAYG